MAVPGASRFLVWTASRRGFVVTKEGSMRHFVLGTAGHIDHGKTELVKALTGIDTDRLKEEKQRGITIELGFAHLDFDDLLVHIVDVPGHERFVRAMTAGATGIDAVMLVVAADEGVMPQTREHLAICDLLGIETGFVALTKVDLVEPDWLELVREDLREFTKDTFLDGCEVVACSAVSGHGLDAVKEQMRCLADRVQSRPEDDLVRLPMDRVFTMRGFGTVVTGTLVSGTLHVGQNLMALPSGVAASVRGLQVHGMARDEVRAGNRVAVNLKGIDRGAIDRGEVLVEPDRIQPTRRLDAMLDYLSWNRRPLKRRKPAILLCGTTQREVQIIPLDADEMEPGTSGPVHLHAEEPVVVRPGDRFILQGFDLNPQHGATIAGGQVVRSHPPRRRRADPEQADEVRRMAEANPADRVEMEVQAAKMAGIDEQRLIADLAYVPKRTTDILKSLVACGSLVGLEGETRFYAHAAVLEEVEAQILARLDELAESDPMAPGFSRQVLRAKLPHRLSEALFDRAVSRLVTADSIGQDREYLVPPKSKNAAKRRELEDRVGSFFFEVGLAPAKVVVAAEQLGMAEKELRQILGNMVKDGRIVRTRDDLYFHATHVQNLKERLVAFLEEHREIEPSQFKEMCGVTRRYVIPLAEMFDERRLTIRVGNVRRLRQR